MYRNNNKILREGKCRWRCSPTEHSLGYDLFRSFRSASLVTVASVSPGANVFYCDLRAVLALYCAAPVELAVAATHYLRALLLNPQSALVAQSAAASLFPLSEAVSVLQALPTLCARKPEAQVLGAIIRRIL